MDITIEAVGLDGNGFLYRATREDGSVLFENAHKPGRKALELLGDIVRVFRPGKGLQFTMRRQH